jgi:predicted metal-dependent enzyme (double-stranded beta helix superfamily)
MPVFPVISPSFLQPDHFRSNPQHYERNAIHISPDGNLSLFALVWLPGQWTPVHDHGSWGVVGIVQGLLEERSFMAIDAEADDLRVALVEFGLQPGHIAELGRADRGEILRVREQDRPATADPVVEPDGAFGGLGGEVRCLGVDSQRHNCTPLWGAAPSP